MVTPEALAFVFLQPIRWIQISRVEVGCERARQDRVLMGIPSHKFCDGSARESLPKVCLSFYVLRFLCNFFAASFNLFPMLSSLPAKNSCG